MALQLTLSCDLNNSQNGPTLIHSTGTEHYKIPPEVVRLDEFLLCDCCEARCRRQC